MTGAPAFKIKQKNFLDNLIQKKYFLIMKIHNFRGDLTDTSAKKEALRMTINIQLLSNIWSHVELPYDIRCLILKEGLHLPCSRQQQDIISLA